MTQPTDKKPHAGVVHRASREDAAGPLTDPASSLFRVFECIRSLDERGIEPTRDLIAQRTQLPLTTVDDRIKLLRIEGLISPRKQCYRPLAQHAPARHVGVTVLADGMVKLEAGDVAMDLTPTEAQRVGTLLQGHSGEDFNRGRVAVLEAQLAKHVAEMRKVQGLVNEALEVQARTTRQPRLDGM